MYIINKEPFDYAHLIYLLQPHLVGLRLFSNSNRLLSSEREPLSGSLITQKPALPAKLGVKTKGGKLVVTASGDRLVIEKQSAAVPPLPEPIQIVQIETDEPPREVRID